MKRLFFSVASMVLLVLPVVALAQFRQVDTFFKDINSFINNILIPLVISIALLIFIWGVFKMFIFGGDDETKREEGRQLILYSIIGFVLIVSIWGIVNLISGGLGFNAQDLQTVPNTVNRNR